MFVIAVIARPLGDYPRNAILERSTRDKLSRNNECAGVVNVA